MSVDDWARREAERAFDGVHIFTAHGFRQGIVHAFDALLSDEAIRAAARGIGASDHPVGLQIARAALQAAIAAVTEGSPE